MLEYVNSLFTTDFREFLIESKKFRTNSIRIFIAIYAVIGIPVCTDAAGVHIVRNALQLTRLSEVNTGKQIGNTR